MKKPTLEARVTERKGDGAVLVLYTVRHPLIGTYETACFDTAVRVFKDTVASVLRVQNAIDNASPQYELAS